MLNMLPDAVQQERILLLEDAVALLEKEHAAELRVHDLAGYGEPDPVIIPVLNVPMQPDIIAHVAGSDETVVALVEVSSSLGDEACGRRWQAFSNWAKDHHGSLRVFVHPEDQARAEAIARHWHIDIDHVVPVQRSAH